MTQFAKFIDTDTIRRPVKHLRTPNLIAFNFDQNETLLREQGYLPLVELNTVEEVTDDEHWAKPQFALIDNGDSSSNYITVTYIGAEYESDELPTDQTFV